MKTLDKNLADLRDHLWKVLGILTSLPETGGAKMPLWLHERFAFYETNAFFGRPVTLALERESPPTTPKAWKKLHDVLEAETKTNVVLVLPGLQSGDRNRLVHHKVSFITPGKQIFLPKLLVDLREKFGPERPVVAVGKPLSAIAQVIILHHLLKKEESKTLMGLAQRLGYTNSSITYAKNELVANDICRTTKSGKSLSLDFKLKGRELWEKVLPKLSSPVVETIYTDLSVQALVGPYAGFSALSFMTDIIDDRLACVAGGRKAVRLARKHADFKEYPYDDEAALKLEVWRYDPRVLTDRDTVDRLSLYLSLRHSPDERVQQALESLINGVTW